MSFASKCAVRVLCRASRLRHATRLEIVEDEIRGDASIEAPSCCIPYRLGVSHRRARDQERLSSSTVGGMQIRRRGNRLNTSLQFWKLKNLFKSPAQCRHTSMDRFISFRI